MQRKAGLVEVVVGWLAGEPTETSTQSDDEDLEKQPFYPTHSELKLLGGSKDLPQSIYGAAMMVAIRTSQRHGIVVEHGISASVILGLVLNVVMQVYVVYCTKSYITAPAVKAVRELYSGYHEAVWPDGLFSQEGWDAYADRDRLCQIPFSQPVFFMALLLIWTGACMVDLKESVAYMNLWLHLGQPTGGRLADLEEDDGAIVAKRASKMTKFLVLFFVLLPKVAIAVLVWWLGARWLAATPSLQDLVLNAVALAFITELDELIYNVIMPEDVMALVEKYKIARPEDEEAEDSGEEARSKRRHRQLCSRMVKMLSSIAVVIVVPIVYMHYLQQVIPDYKWDIRAVCIEWNMEYHG